MPSFIGPSPYVGGRRGLQFFPIINNSAVNVSVDRELFSLPDELFP